MNKIDKIIQRTALNDFDAYRIANSMESYGLSVFAITCKDHRYTIWAKMTIRESIYEAYKITYEQYSKYLDGMDQ